MVEGGIADVPNGICSVNICLPSDVSKGALPDMDMELGASYSDVMAAPSATQRCCDTAFAEKRLRDARGRQFAIRGSNAASPPVDRWRAFDSSSASAHTSRSRKSGSEPIRKSRHTDEQTRSRHRSLEQVATKGQVAGFSSVRSPPRPYRTLGGKSRSLPHVSLSYSADATCDGTANSSACPSHASTSAGESGSQEVGHATNRSRACGETEEVLSTAALVGPSACQESYGGSAASSAALGQTDSPSRIDLDRLEDGSHRAEEAIDDFDSAYEKACWEGNADSRMDRFAGFVPIALSARAIKTELPSSPSGNCSRLSPKGSSLCDYRFHPLSRPSAHTCEEVLADSHTHEAHVPKEDRSEKEEGLASGEAFCEEHEREPVAEQQAQPGETEDLGLAEFESVEPEEAPLTQALTHAEPVKHTELVPQCEPVEPEELDIEMDEGGMEEEFIEQDEPAENVARSVPSPERAHEINELYEWHRRMSEKRDVKVYCDAVVNDVPMSPELANFGESLVLNDELLAWYLVDKVVCDVILDHHECDVVDLDWQEADLERQTRELVLLEQDVPAAQDDGYYEICGNAHDIFDMWALILDDLYDKYSALPPPHDDQGLRAETDPRVVNYLKCTHFVVSLIQFVVLIHRPHCWQDADKAARRSKVALDILIYKDYSNMIFGNQLFVLKNIIFMCFSAIETKPSGQVAVSNHVTGLISYIYSINPEEVRSFITSFESSIFMLAYYIDLPGVVDLCLRLLFHNPDLRPVRTAGQIQDPNFIQYLADVAWFNYLITVLEGTATQGEVKAKQDAVLLLLARFFEISELYFRSLQKEPVTYTHLYSLVHHAAVGAGVTKNLLQIAVDTGNMEAINVVLVIIKIQPLMEACGEEIGGMLQYILRSETTVASPSRSRESAKRPRDGLNVISHVGAMECAQLQIIKLHLEEVKCTTWMPVEFWYTFQRWYLDREKRNHVCHSILFAMWKTFVQYAPFAVLDEILPALLKGCADEILVESQKNWCDMFLVKNAHVTDGVIHLSRSCRFTKVERRNVGLGTLLQLILYVADRGEEVTQADKTCKVMNSPAFMACADLAYDLRELSANYAASALDLRRKSAQVVEETADTSNSNVNDPPPIAPPQPPSSGSDQKLYDRPLSVHTTRPLTTRNAADAFNSGVCFQIESQKCLGRREASSSRAILTELVVDDLIQVESKSETRRLETRLPSAATMSAKI